MPSTAPNTQSTLAYDSGMNKTSIALSTNIIILVNNVAVGAVKSLSINEDRSIVMLDEVGTDGHIDSSPTKSTDISGSCDRVRFDGLRIAEAFSRGFVHASSQAYPFDIVILDKQKSDTSVQISTIIKNVWIKSISYSYQKDDWQISEKMDWVAESISSHIAGGKSVAIGGERRITHSTPVMTIGDNNQSVNIEQAADTGLYRGSMSASGLIDLISSSGTLY